jgi:prophage antirepressor-like protein
MDILKAFSLLGDGSDEHQINIKGTPEDPLFQANQIGKLLGLGNISAALKDFGVDERCIISKAGPLISNEGSVLREESLFQTNFLTELGLYRLLARSRKPIAAIFQKWMIKTIKEIRINGMYQLKAENEVDRKIIEYNCLLKNHSMFLNVYDDKTVVYILKLLTIEDKFIIKIGHTDNIKERTQNISNSYNTDYPILLDVFEIYNNCNCEKQIRKNEFLKNLIYTKNVKKNNKQSRETYLVDNEQYNEIVKIIFDIKKTYFLSESQSLKLKMELEEKRNENIRLQGEYGIKQQELTVKQQELTVKQRELELEIKKIDSEYRKTDVEEIPDAKLTDGEDVDDDNEDKEVDKDKEIDNRTCFTVKKRMNGERVPFVYQYNPTDLKTWIKKWDSPADVERNINDISPAPLRSSAKNNTIYKDFRWVFLSRNVEPPAEIEATINNKHKSPEVHLIAMIDIKKTKILAVYKNQKEAVEARNLKCNSFTRAIKEETVSSGHYWNYFDKCSDEMKKEYLSHSNLPEKYVPNSGKHVQQVDPTTNRVLHTYRTNREICKLFQMSVTKLKDVIKSNEIHKGFKWVNI